MSSTRSVRFSEGYIRLGRLAGVGVWMHWTWPIGAFFLGRLEWAPVFWFALFTLTIVHELGHALLARGYRAQVLSINLSMFGGTCKYRGEGVDARGHAVIAWGGVAAQALVAIAVGVLRLVLGPPQSLLAMEAYNAFLVWNLIVIALNLLPIPSLDGAIAWRLFRLPRRPTASPGETITPALAPEPLENEPSPLQASLDRAAAKAAENFGTLPKF